MWWKKMCSLKKQKSSLNKVVLLISAIMMLFIIFAVPVNGDSLNSKDSDKVVKVGFCKNYGFVSDDAGQVTSGYCYDYLNEIARYTGWKYEFIPVSWNGGLKKLKWGDIDIFGPIQKTTERENVYDFPKEEFGFEYGAVYVDEKNDKILYNDIKALDGISVGTVENNFYNDLLDSFCEKNGIEVKHVYTNDQDHSRALNQGKYDAFVGGSLVEMRGTKVVAKISSEPFYFATTKGNKSIIDGLTLGRTAIFRADPYFSTKLAEKYYGSESINVPTFTREEMDYIEKHRTMTVACDPDWAPVEYIDSKTQKCKGINVDILNEISKICGIKFNYVKTSDYDESMELSNEGKADLLMGYTHRGNKSLNVTYTDPFTEIPVMLIARKNMSLSDDLKVAMRKLDSTLAKEIIAEYPNFTYLNFETSKEVFDAIEKRKADAAFISTYVYDELARKDEIGEFIAITTKVNFDQSIGVSNRLDPIVVSIFNKAIGQLDPGQVSTIIFANTVSRSYDIPISRIIREYSFSIIAILFLFIITMVVISLKNQKKLKKIAYYDLLTGIYSLTRFKQRTEEILKNARESEYLFMSIDFDEFKYINNSYGYDVGNEILIAVANRLVKNAQEGEVYCRAEGDHFLYLTFTERLTGFNKFKAVLGEIREDFNEILPGHYHLSVSVGAYIIEDVKEDFSDILDKANAARKSIKGNGTLDFVIYTSLMNEEMNWKKEVILSMDSAIKNGEFEVYLQPKFLLEDETLVGAEALSRWNHPIKKLIQPASFIDILEQNGFILKLDYYVFEEVCKLIKRWEKTLENSNITISVNFSRLHIGNENFVEELIEITKKHNVSPEKLEVELTESIVFKNTVRLVSVMKKLKEAGFKISIDDFGSGYSSLNMLKDLPVDIIKLDKEFLSGPEGNSNETVIIESVTQMARKLNLITVAEGVESKEQAEMLLGIGCDIAQGYYYARPMQVDNFEKLM